MSNINYQSIQSSQIYINSNTADIYLNNTMKSNVVFFFKQPVQLNKNALEMRVSLVNSQIPMSFYNINNFTLRFLFLFNNHWLNIRITIIIIYFLSDFFISNVF